MTDLKTSKSCSAFRHGKVSPGDIGLAMMSSAGLVIASFALVTDRARRGRPLMYAIVRADKGEWLPEASVRFAHPAYL